MIEIDANKFVAEGKRNSPRECPVALALLKTIRKVRKDLKAVSVLGDTAILYWRDGRTSETVVDDTIVAAIKKFDETGKATFPKMFIGSQLEVILDELASGTLHKQGEYRRKEEA